MTAKGRNGDPGGWLYPGKQKGDNLQQNLSRLRLEYSHRGRPRELFINLPTCWFSNGDGWNIGDMGSYDQSDAELTTGHDFCSTSLPSSWKGRVKDLFFFFLFPCISIERLHMH